MTILYKKIINVPSGFYCTNCPYLISEKNLQNKYVWYCRLSGLYKQENSKGQMIKDHICIDNCIETLQKN